MIQRNLDPCFFTLDRDGVKKLVCFSDLTLSEKEIVTKEYTREQLLDLAIKLGDALMFIGDYYNLEYKEIK